MLQQFTKPAGMFFVLLLATACGPTLTDISPDRKNGVVNGGVSTAGLVLNLAGSSFGLYAVALNSGIWRTTANPEGTFSPWKQLPQSPRYAHCLALDPNVPGHVVVGERDGDAINLADNHCGVWESFDGGDTFDPRNYFDPSLHGCTSQVVNGVVITNQSTILISTPCGIGRKEKTAPAFGFAKDLAGQSFTGIAIFDDWIVARTVDAIYISHTDGQNWERHAIKLNFAGQVFTQGYFPEHAGVYSVAILELPPTRTKFPVQKTGQVFVYLPVTRQPNEPNQSSYLVFNNQAQTWNYQVIPDRGLGTGAGGRVFMKSFLLKNGLLKRAIGGNTQLVYCGAQNVFLARSISPDGMVSWKNIANRIFDPVPSPIHADMEDFLIDPNGWYGWVSCDGGVYDVAMDHQQSMVNLNIGQQYGNLNNGLHISHMHQSFVSGLSPGTDGKERYGSGAQDNGGRVYIADASGTFSWVEASDGDANMTEGDQGNPNYLLSGVNPARAVLMSLKPPGAILPVAARTGPVTVNYTRTYSFQFIQTPVNDYLPPYLDAVMLSDLPLQYVKDQAQYAIDGKLTNVPGNLGMGPGIALLRNPQFAATPDINLTMGFAWSPVFTDLPPGPRAVWVSGGHADPMFYLLCSDGGKQVLWRRRKSETSWQRITDLDHLTLNTYAPGTVQHGPVFVNPYDPQVVYVSCTDGIYHSVQGGHGAFLFVRDDALTSLVSGSGKYPLDKAFPGGNDHAVSWSNQSSANGMYPLSWMSFNRLNTKQIAASSPYTGVFCKDENDAWEDFSDLLPKPFTPVSGVQITNKGLYVTTEGRGMFFISK